MLKFAFGVCIGLLIAAVFPGLLQAGAEKAALLWGRLTSKSK